MDDAVKELVKAPLFGEEKLGGLGGYKFKVTKQLTLLSYSNDESALTLELMALGTHENFYRDVFMFRTIC